MTIVLDVRKSWVWCTGETKLPWIQGRKEEADWWRCKTGSVVEVQCKSSNLYVYDIRGQQIQYNGAVNNTDQSKNLAIGL